jgi:hypothetical protein
MKQVLAENPQMLGAGVKECICSGGLAPGSFALLTKGFE